MINDMYENAKSWRRRLRIQSLVEIAKKEIISGKSFNEFSPKLEQEMKIRWKLVSSTRRQYLHIVRKALAKQFVVQQF